jgi:hypothetical protein
MESSQDAAERYNEGLKKSVEKLKNKNMFYSSMASGSKIFNAITGVAYPFLSGSRQECMLWKVVVAEKNLVLYYDGPEEWLQHKKKYFKYDSYDLQTRDNVIVWHEPSEEEVISMKANGKKKVPKYIPKINPMHRQTWESRRQLIL